MFNFMKRRTFFQVALFPRLGVVLSVALVGCAGDGVRSAGESTASKVASTGNAALDRELAVEADLDGEAVYPLPDSLDYRGSLPLAYEFEGGDGTDVFMMATKRPNDPISCVVYPHEVDLLVTAGRLLRNFEAHIEKQLEPPIRKTLQQVVAGVSGAHAYHGLIRLWSNDKGFAQPKAVAGNAAGLGVVCVHLGLGHQKTLVGVLTHLMASLERAEPVAKPYFEEVAVAEFAGHAVGLVRVRMYLDSEGDSEILAESSMMLPTENGSLEEQYSSIRSWSRPDGSLINATETALDLDGVRTSLEIRPTEDRWTVSGTYEGKPLDLVLEHRGKIDSELAEYLMFTRRLRPHGNQDRETQMGWSSDVDPSRVTESIFEVDPTDSSRIQHTVGPIQMQLERGSDGLPDRMTVPMGEGEISTRMLYRAGSLR